MPPLKVGERVTFKIGVPVFVFLAIDRPVGISYSSSFVNIALTRNSYCESCTFKKMVLFYESSAMPLH